MNNGQRTPLYTGRVCILLVICGALNEMFASSLFNCSLLLALKYKNHFNRGPTVAQQAESWPVIYLSRIRDQLEAKIFSVVNEVLLHTTFHYHPPSS